MRGAEELGLAAVFPPFCVRRPCFSGVVVLPLSLVGCSGGAKLWSLTASAHVRTLGLGNINTCVFYHKTGAITPPSWGHGCLSEQSRAKADGKRSSLARAWAWTPGTSTLRAFVPGEAVLGGSLPWKGQLVTLPGSDSCFSLKVHKLPISWASGIFCPGNRGGLLGGRVGEDPRAQGLSSGI